MRVARFIPLLILLISCSSRENIQAGLESIDVDSIIKACVKLKDSDDVEFVPLLLEKPYDQRETFLLKHKGTTVYQQKMAALSRISGLKPPQVLTYKVDSSIVGFYKNWARQKNYIK